MLLANAPLDPDVEDSISWNWTSNGIYSAASAYAVQFQGSYPKFFLSKMWSAHVELKYKFFSWLALHGKILMADKLAICR